MVFPAMSLTAARSHFPDLLFPAVDDNTSMLNIWTVTSDN
jgi:hypothetical protein